MPVSKRIYLKILKTFYFYWWEVRLLSSVFKLYVEGTMKTSIGSNMERKFRCLGNISKMMRWSKMQISGCDQLSTKLI